MSQGEGSEGKVGNDGLDILQDAASRCRVSVMSDSHISRQSLKPLLSKYIRNETHGLFNIELSAVRRTYPCPFLPPVLKSVETKIGEVGCLSMVKHSKYPAFLTNVVERISRRMTTA